MITWALSILGGSILAILGTSYIKPVGRRVRLLYLLFLPGWGFICSSIFWGSLIARKAIAYELVKSAENKSAIVLQINSCFAAQLDTLNLGLSIFALWLVSFLLFWIFSSHFDKPKELII